MTNQHFKQKQYYLKHMNCNLDWKKQVNKFVSQSHQRFNSKLLNVPDLYVKCVKYEDFITGSYHEYMSRRLTTRRVVKSISVYSTNRGRNFSAECLWKDASTMNKIT